MAQDPLIEAPIVSPRQTVAGMPVNLGPGMTGSYTGSTNKLPANVTPVAQSTGVVPVKDASSKLASSNVKDAVYRSGFVPYNQPPVAPMPNKYHSIHTMKDAQKIDALKDTKLNPALIEDGYDSIAHAMYLWTQVGAKAKTAGNISFDEQKKIAGNFYDRVIYPAYGQLSKDRGGIQPISKEMWQKQAYEEALNYKI